MVALVTAFLGMLLVVQPGSGELGWAVVLPLLAALLWASTQIIAGHYAKKDNAITTNLFSSAGALLVLTPIIAFAEQKVQLSLSESRLVLALTLFCVFSTAAQMLQFEGVRIGPLSKGAPFAYVQLVAAAGLGWWVFGHLPNLVAGLGAALIIVTGASSSFWRQAPIAVLSTNPGEL